MLLYRYGNPEPSAFEKITAEITKTFGEVLGVVPDHMYIKYDASMIGDGMEVISKLNVINHLKNKIG